MDRWEYWTFVMARPATEDWDRQFLECGSRGWELVSVVLEAWHPEHGVADRYRVVFKRRVQPS